MQHNLHCNSNDRQNAVSLHPNEMQIETLLRCEINGLRPYNYMASTVELMVCLVNGSDILCTGGYLPYLKNFT